MDIPQGGSGHTDEGHDTNSKNHPRPSSIGSNPGDALAGDLSAHNLTSSHHSHQGDGGNQAVKSGHVPDPEKINRGYRDVNQGAPSSKNPGSNRQRFGNR